MKKIISISFIIISTLGFSQNYNFKPNWKKGQTKIVSIKKVEKEFENDNLLSDTVTYNEAKLKVTKENKDFYTLEVVFENQALQAVVSFYDKIGEDLKEYKDLKLIYTIDKQTAKSQLQNWEDAQKFMYNSFDQISVILKEKAPEESILLDFMFMPLKEIFKSKENIEAYMESTIGYVLSPYSKNFEINKTITKVEKQENPFNSNQEISSTTLLTLKELNKSLNSCIIEEEVILDLSEFIEMMKGMMKNMSKSFGVNDSTANSKVELVDDFNMEMTNKRITTYNYEKSWVTMSVATGVITSTDPTNGIITKKEIISTTTIK